MIDAGLEGKVALITGAKLLADVAVQPRVSDLEAALDVTSVVSDDSLAQFEDVL